jgi:thiamine-monophosphate kinase
MIDVSDGLLADLQHILDGSGVGAEIEQPALPLSDPFRQELKVSPDLIALALTGGEDYELLFAAPEGADNAIAMVSRQTGVPITNIGRLVARSTGLRLLGPSGDLELPNQRGYKHFPETP